MQCKQGSIIHLWYLVTTIVTMIKVQILVGMLFPYMGFVNCCYLIILNIVTQSSSKLLCGVGKVKIGSNPSGCGIECNPSHPSSIPLSDMLSYNECIVVMALSPIVNLALCPKESSVYLSTILEMRGRKFLEAFIKIIYLEKNESINLCQWNVAIDNIEYC